MKLLDPRLSITCGGQPRLPLRPRPKRGDFGISRAVSGSDAAPFPPAGTSVRSFPASAVGIDVQWARGLAETRGGGEWQRRLQQPILASDCIV